LINDARLGPGGPVAAGVAATATGAHGPVTAVGAWPASVAADELLAVALEAVVLEPPAAAEELVPALEPHAATEAVIATATRARAVRRVLLTGSGS
jgi:hypothetical protein